MRKLAAALMLLLSIGEARAELDLRANERPLPVTRDDNAISKIPPNYRFVEPGVLTVADFGVKFAAAGAAGQRQPYAHRQRPGHCPFTGG